MAYEIFGIFTIGEITGIAALISSALIFYFGYSQTRKSEQMKIAREVMDRIAEKIEKLRGIQLPEGRTQNGVEVDRRVSEGTADEIVTVAYDLSRELAYYRYLLQIHAIRDWNLIWYYKPLVHGGFVYAKAYLSATGRTPAGSLIRKMERIQNSIRMEEESRELKYWRGFIWWKKRGAELEL